MLGQLLTLAQVALRRQKKPDIGSDERESGHA